MVFIGHEHEWTHSKRHGKDYGMHFPLHANTEVVVSCINGDINRPIIFGSIPNPDNTSPITNKNNSQNIIRTHGDNELLMDDTIYAEKIELFTHDKEYSLTLDAKKDAHKVHLASEQGRTEIKAGKRFQHRVRRQPTPAQWRRPYNHCRNQQRDT